MGWDLSILVLCVAAAVAQELPLAEVCDPEACQLPDCRCSNTEIPGNLRARDTPQFVIVTFDDAINVLNIETYRRILDDRRNINQCTAKATFFINHEYTNYALVNELYNKGHEIALHSITHRTDQDFWREATSEDMMREFGDQRIQMAHFANIPFNEIRGLRMPFLQMAGNATFEAMTQSGLTYDCSWPTITSLDPGIWPYTLDYASTQECVVPPCPTASIPGVWVHPMMSWQDLNGLPCSMVDACFPDNTPDHADEDAWFNFIVGNFERHYFGNRAPFGFYVHEWFISRNPAIEAALVRFMDMINNLNDAFMVSPNDVIDWVKNPVPINEYVTQACPFIVPTTCPSNSCGPLYSDHNENSGYWMQICQQCPPTYPWINNPLGQ